MYAPPMGWGSRQPGSAISPSQAGFEPAFGRSAGTSPADEPERRPERPADREPAPDPKREPEQGRAGGPPPPASGAAREARLADLAEAIERIESRTNWHGRGSRHALVPTGWAPVDEALRGGLARAAIHEWLGLAEPDTDETPGEAPGGVPSGGADDAPSDGARNDARGDRSARRRRWLPPLGTLAHLARRALSVGDADDAPGWALWIGRRCWPYPRVFMARDAGDRALLERSIFIDARSAGERVWAADLALRCPAVSVVVLEARGLGMSETRRLRLAAGAGGALGLLARPAEERRALTAASSRWLVAPAPPCSFSDCDFESVHQPRWSVELLRCKGVQPATSARRWVVRRDHETGAVRLAPESSDRTRAQARPAPRRIA